MNCFLQLQRPGTVILYFVGGESEVTAKIMSYIVTFFDEHKEECQFSLDDILVDYTDEKPNQKWILQKIK